MKKTLLFIALFLAFAFFAISCEEDVRPNVPEDVPETKPDTVLSLDLSSMLPGETIKKSIGNDSVLDFKGINLSDGAIIIDGDFTSSRRLEESEKDMNVFKRQDGTFIPVPDEESNTKITSEDIGVNGTSEIVIKKDNPHIDFAIKAEEYPGETGAKEEFYYVDFSDERWSNLNKEGIVIVKTGEMSNTLSIVQREMGYKNPNGVFDFSEVKTNGFGIDLYAVIDANNTEAHTKVFVTNPIEITEDATVITNDVSVFKVSEKKDGKNYKAVMTLSEESYKAIENSTVFAFSRYFDGTFRDYELVPYFNDVNHSIEYEIGTVDKDFIFNVNSYFNEGVTKEATIKLVPSEIDGSVYTSYSNGSQIELTAKGTSKIQVFPIRIENNSEFSLEYDNDKSQVTLYHTNKYSQGTVMTSSVKMNEKTSCIIIVRCSDNPADGETLVTIKPKEEFELKCDVYFKDGKYVCDGCENCNYNGTILYDIFSNGVMKGTYWIETKSEKYGSIEYVDGMSIENSKGIFLDQGTSGNLGLSYFGTYRYSTENPKNSIDIRVKEIHPTKGEIIVDVTFDGKEDTKEIDVVMIKGSSHSHIWEVKDETHVRCSECNEVRNAYITSISSGDYLFTSNEDFRLIVYGEYTEFKIPMGKDIPLNAPINFDVALIPCDSSKSISVEIKETKQVHVTIN